MTALPIIKACPVADITKDWKLFLGLSLIPARSAVLLDALSCHALLDDFASALLEDGCCTPLLDTVAVLLGAAREPVELDICPAELEILGATEEDEGRLVELEARGATEEDN